PHARLRPVGVGRRFRGIDGSRLGFRPRPNRPATVPASVRSRSCYGSSGDFLLGGTIVIDGTSNALWLPGQAGVSAVEQQPLRDSCPLSRRKQFLKILFDLFRIVGLGQAKALGDPLYVGIDDNSRLTERIA